MIDLREDGEYAVCSCELKVVNVGVVVRSFVDFGHNGRRNFSDDFDCSWRKKFISLYGTHRTIILSRVYPAPVHRRTCNVHIRLKFGLFRWALNSRRQILLILILLLASETFKEHFL